MAGRSAFRVTNRRFAVTNVMSPVRVTRLSLDFGTRING
jgi:hypothetical protein